MGKTPLPVFDLLGARLGFRDAAHPGHLRIGIGDGRDDTSIESLLHAAGDFRSRLAFIAPPCGRAWAGRRYRRWRRYGARWCAAACRPDEAPLIDRDARRVSPDHLAVGARRPTATSTLSKLSSWVPSGPSKVTFETLLLRLDRRHLGFEVNVLVALLDAPVQRFDDVLSAPGMS